MTHVNSERAARWRRTMRTASTLVIAGIAAAGCEREAERPQLLESAQVAVSPRAAATAAEPNLANFRPPLAPALAEPAPAAAVPVRALIANPAETALAPSGVELALEVEQPLPALAANDINLEAPAPALLEGGGSVLADAAYVTQISETERAAYIAQIHGPQPGERMAVRSGEEILGAVQFAVADGQVTVHIGQVLDLFEGRMDPAHFAALRGSPAATEFVALDRLQGAGIPLVYNAAYDELTFGDHGG